MSNLGSALVGLMGVAYLCFLIASYRPAQLFCDDARWGDVTPSPIEKANCFWRISLLDVSRVRRARP